MTLALDAEIGVVGIGAMGSATLWQLAARGVSVIGFERYRPGHDRGSSHGATRIIRTAYAESPEYVPMLQAAFGLWRDLEAATGADLLRMTGGLMIGRPGTELITGVVASLRAHNLPHEVLDSTQMRQRYPQHRLDRDEIAIFESQAGFLRPEDAVRVMAGLAESLGARTICETAVLRIDARRDAVTVVTDAGSFTFRQVVVCAGAWTANLLPELAMPLEPERNVMGWFAVDDPLAYAPDRFPIFIHEYTEGHTVYGFPSTDARTMKAAVHYGGYATTAETLDRTVYRADLAPLETFVRARLTGAKTPAAEAVVCMYTNTPDRHFLIGRAPGIDRVVIVSPCSGHGFKFSPVVGQLASELALGLPSSHDISLFDPKRYAVGGALNNP
ncbi:MAG: N-methyl-L-tryptophan oxidase [Candidatus Dormibacteria bacterium]